MAKIRAYKLAEELGIEREEFVEKVRALGIELRGAMTGLDDDQARVFDALTALVPGHGPAGG